MAKLNKHDEAIECYKKCLELNKNCAVAYNNIGFSLAKLNRHKEAIKYFDECLRLDPDYTNASLNKGNSLLIMNKYNDAVKSYLNPLETKLSGFFHRFSKQ